MSQQVIFHALDCSCELKPAAPRLQNHWDKSKCVKELLSKTWGNMFKQAHWSAINHRSKGGSSLAEVRLIDLHQNCQWWQFPLLRAAVVRESVLDSRKLRLWLIYCTYSKKLCVHNQQKPINQRIHTHTHASVYTHTCTCMFITRHVSKLKKNI